MIKTTLLSITAAMALATGANASLVVLSAGFGGPFAFTSGGDRVNSGLIRVGTVAPAADFGDFSIGAIDTVFMEFGTATTTASGGLGNTISNANGTPFNDQQIYIWIFGEGTASGEHGLFTVADPANPAAGSDWFFPTHTGAGTDSVTITLSSIVSDGNLIVPGTSAAGNAITLAVPEPSGVLLAGLAGMFLVFRRRR